MKLWTAVSDLFSHVISESHGNYHMLGAVDRKEQNFSGVVVASSRSRMESVVCCCWCATRTYYFHSWNIAEHRFQFQDPSGRQIAGCKDVFCLLQRWQTIFQMCFAVKLLYHTNSGLDSTRLMFYLCSLLQP